MPNRTGTAANRLRSFIARFRRWLDARRAARAAARAAEIRATMVPPPCITPPIPLDEATLQLDPMTAAPAALSAAWLDCYYTVATEYPERESTYRGLAIMRQIRAAVAARGLVLNEITGAVDIAPENAIG